jgi:hypothetical protein
MDNVAFADFARMAAAPYPANKRVSSVDRMRLLHLLHAHP